MLRTAVRFWTTLLLALSVLSGFGATGLMASASAQGNDNICEPRGSDSGDKIDVTDERTSVTVTAPEGKVIVGYCVKAGSANQGLGPEYEDVAPVSQVTISHSTGKGVSHYIVFYAPEETPKPEKPSSTGSSDSALHDFSCEAGTAQVTRTTWDDVYTWDGTSWVVTGRTNVQETVKTVSVPADEIPADAHCGQPDDEQVKSDLAKEYVCEDGVKTITWTVTTTSYSWVPGQGWVAGTPVVEHRSKTVDLASPPAGCDRPTGELTVTDDPEITCEAGTATTTTTTYAKVYEWVPGSGWELETDGAGEPVRGEKLDEKTVTEDLASGEACEKPDDEVETEKSSRDVCVDGVTETTTTTTTTSYSWVPGTGWVAGEPVVTKKVEVADLASPPADCGEPTGQLSQTDDPQVTCEAGTATTTTTTYAKVYAWVPGSGWELEVDGSGDPVKGDELSQTTETVDLEGAPEDCTEPQSSGSETSGVENISCTDGTGEVTTTTWDESYLWVPGMGWEKEVDLLSGEPKRVNESSTTETVDLESPPEACEDPSREEVTESSETVCTDGTVTQTTTTEQITFGWFPGQGWEQTSSEVVSSETVTRTATDEECPPVEEGPVDACPDLDGEQPVGFPCDKQPTTQTVSGDSFSCELGVGTREGTLTTTYEFVEGQWVGTTGDPVWGEYSYVPLTEEQKVERGCAKAPETRSAVQTSQTCELGNGVREGVVTTTFTWDGSQWVGTDSAPVFGEWRYTPLTPAQEAALGCDGVVQPPEEICTDVSGGEVVDGECTRPDETVDLFEELSRTCDGVTSRRGTVTTSYDYDPSIGGFVATTTTSYEEPVTAPLTAAESAALGCDTVEPPEPIDPTDPVDPTDPTEPTDPGSEPTTGPQPGPRPGPTTVPAIDPGQDVAQLPATGTAPGLLGAGVLGTLVLLAGAGLLTRRRTVED